MIINITSTQLSDSNKSLINAVFDANLDAVLNAAFDVNNEVASNTGVKTDQASDSPPIIIFSGDGVFAQSSTLILFCASSWRSALAAKTLQDMGMTNIIDMDGGFSGWKLAGLPIKTE